MTDTLTTTTEISSAVQIFYNKALLSVAYPSMPHAQWGQKGSMPTNSGDRVKWRRYTALSTATTPLTEGINPAGQRLSKTDLLAVLDQYGDFVHITEKVMLTVEDRVMKQASKLLGKQAGQTFDEITRDILMSCASVTLASNGSNGSTPTEIHKKDIQGVVRTLCGNDAEMFEPIVKASTGVGTSPVRESFWAVIHTDLLPDLEACSGFKSVANYASLNVVADHEWGNVDNVRFVKCSNADYTSGSPDTYRIPIIGREAYGVVDLAGHALEMIYHDAKIAGGALELSSTMGWKGWYVSRVLNDNFMHLLKVSKNL